MKADKKGFFSDYYYQISQNAKKDKPIYIAIMPNNTPGTVIPDDESDYQETFRGFARTRWMKSNISRLLREKLEIATLVPAFPTQNNSGVYSNLLNDKSMNHKRKRWNRVDLQLIKIIEDARKNLEKQGYKVHEKVLFYGFSSQADFANRFALLHPHLVKAVAVGGIVDYITPPISEYKNKKLNYPVGIADIDAIGKHEFSLDALKDVKFFWFDGNDDTNTTFNKHYGVWKNEDIDLIYEIFAGKKYDEKKLYDAKILENVLKIMKEKNINFTYKRYKNVRHDFTNEMKNDVVEFFSKITTEK